VTRPGLPETVRDFLSTHIRSMSELEVLLLLQRDPSRWWTAHQVNAELKSSLESASTHLEHLCLAGLLQQRKVAESAEQEYRFHADEAHLATIAQLATALSRGWVAAIVDAIYAARRNSIRDFADAFRLGKKGDPNDG
jgi:predicted transcriptional regulator